MIIYNGLFMLILDFQNFFVGPAKNKAKGLELSVIKHNLELVILAK